MAARSLLVTATLAVLLAACFASLILDRDTKKVSIKAGTLKGKKLALVTYTDKKGVNRVLVSNAINARPYSGSTKQVAFKLDRKGGWGFFRDAKAYLKLKNSCKVNSSLKKVLPNVVFQCTMPDGSHWVAQTWQRLHKNMGVKLKAHVPVELRISHFTNAYIAKLWLKWSWSVVGPDQFDHLYGAASCNGWPVYGTKSSPTGVPQDTYGRNIYVDVVNPTWTRNGAYTRSGGWICWNSFLAHKGTGAFCATIWKKLFGVSYPGWTQATKIRAMMDGPGVTPVVAWEGPPPGPYQANNFVGGNYLNGPSSTPPVSAGRQPYSDAVAIPLNQEQQRVVGRSDTCYKIWGKTAK